MYLFRIILLWICFCLFSSCIDASSSQPFAAADDGSGEQAVGDVNATSAEPQKSSGEPSSGQQSESPVPEPVNEQKVIAVTGFDVLSAAANDDNKEILAKLLVQVAETTLCKERFFKVVERIKTQQILDEQLFGEDGSNVGNRAQQLGALLGADFVLTGGAILYGNKTRLDVKCVNVSDGRIMAAESANIDSAEFDRIERAMEHVVISLTSHLMPDHENAPWLYSSRVDKPLSPQEEVAFLTRRIDYVKSAYTAPAQKRVTPVDTIVQNFIDEYLHVYESGDIESLLDFYGPNIQFFTMGKVDKNVVRKELHYYFNRWPSRRRVVTGPISISDTGDSSVKRVEYTYEYRVEKGAKSKSGFARDSYLLSISPEGEVRIVGENSEVLKRF